MSIVPNCPFQTIRLNNSAAVAYISTQDFELISSRTWIITSNGYARESSDPKELMHRLVMQCGELEVHHINGNKLDNRRENLEVLSRVIHRGTIGLSKRNTSGFKGVTFNKARNKWKANLMYDGESYYLGLFENAELAAREYDAKVKALGLNKSFLNFP
jgi:hypothetical protein